MPKRLILSPELFKRFENDLRSHRPVALTELEMADLPQAISFAAASATTGFMVRFALKDGTTSEVFFNPVIAQLMAQQIFEMGQKAQRLDANGNLSSGTVPPLDS